MDPLIITVAAVGAELTLDQQPNLPVTSELLAADAAACEAAGASIYHLHVRGPHAEPTMDVEVFRAAKQAIEDASDLIVQFTTGGAVGDPESARIAPLDLRPEMATLTTGTVNFGDEVFMNPVPLIMKLYEKMLALGVRPEYEIFEAGMIGTADRLYDELEADHHRHFDFVLGVPGAMPAWDGSVEWLASQLASGSTWSATGIGRAHLPVAAAAIASGGHVRTGFEDVRYFEPGRLAESNSELIERVAAMGRDAGREPSTPEQTRNLLGLSSRARYAATMSEQKRRKADQIFEPGYVEDLSGRSVDELKEIREDCDQLENEISYERRLCHGRVDILTAELDHRAGKAGDVISRLPEILASGSGTTDEHPLPERAPDLTAPEHAGGPRRRIEEIAGKQQLARLSDMEPEEIKDLIEQINAYEKGLSTKRKALHEVLDKIQNELVSRYTSGEANDAVLPR